MKVFRRVDRKNCVSYIAGNFFGTVGVVSWLRRWSNELQYCEESGEFVDCIQFSSRLVSLEFHGKSEFTDDQ